jgi:hypothetical protein
LGLTLTYAADSHDAGICVRRRRLQISMSRSGPCDWLPAPSTRGADLGFAARSRHQTPLIPAPSRAVSVLSRQSTDNFKSCHVSSGDVSSAAPVGALFADTQPGCLGDACLRNLQLLASLRSIPPVPGNGETPHDAPARVLSNTAGYTGRCADLSRPPLQVARP